MDIARPRASGVVDAMGQNRCARTRRSGRLMTRGRVRGLRPAWQRSAAAPTERQRARATEIQDGSEPPQVCLLAPRRKNATRSGTRQEDSADPGLRQPPSCGFSRMVTIAVLRQQRVMAWAGVGPSAKTRARCRGFAEANAVFPAPGRSFRRGWNMHAWRGIGPQQASVMELTVSDDKFATREGVMRSADAPRKWARITRIRPSPSPPTPGCRGSASSPRRERRMEGARFPRVNNPAEVAHGRGLVRRPMVDPPTDRGPSPVKVRRRIDGRSARGVFAPTPIASARRSPGSDEARCRGPVRGREECPIRAGRRVGRASGGRIAFDDEGAIVLRIPSAPVESLVVALLRAPCRDREPLQARAPRGEGGRNSWRGRRPARPAATAPFAGETEGRVACPFL